MVVRLGIIGLSADQGAWATMAHVSPFKPDGPLTDQYKLTALATSNPDSAKAAAKAHGLPPEKAYSKPEDIAHDPDVDMVVVSVKVPLHKQMTVPALYAKKDVFIEWPMGASLAEAEEMNSLAKKQGVKNYVGLQARMQAPFVKAREIVASGALGRVTSTTVLGIDSALMDFPEKARYINDPNSGASILSIPVMHTLDAVLHVLASELSSLSATAITTYPTISFLSPTGDKSAPEPKRFADNIAISGTLTPGGGVLSFQYLITAPATPSTFHLTICGEKGALKMEGTNFAVQMVPPKLYQATAPEGAGQKGVYESREGGAEWEEVEVPKGRMHGHFGGVAELYEAIAMGKGKEDGIVDFEEAVKRHRMVEAIARSARDGSRESYL
ncbi:MAG: hypothetical protein Q9184_004837 [Pyrenodesmia sp. 2 TL-2023]